MKCSKCQTENREGAKFCRECGSKIVHTCPQCGKIVLPASKYCDECGHDLSILQESAQFRHPFEDKLDQIQAHFLKDVTESVLAQREEIEGELKQVTVMFCDLEDFTPLSEMLGPEHIYSMMDNVYEILINKVHEYGGTVNEMTGDGIMALFGAPIAMEESPQRAIRSSLAIHREMTKFSDRMKGELGVGPMKMRIGIHTGPVVVGTLGHDLRVEFKAVGDTVNLASRTEGLAEPGTTYVTEETFKLTEGLFRFEALGERQIKGKEAPIKVYHAITPSTSRTRFDVSAERGLTRFVGRERELELLLDSYERAKAGRGQVCSIIGEAGVGKSRLLYEFRKAIANEDVTFLEGRCLSYSSSIAFHPLIDLLKSNFDVRENDDDSLTRSKVTVACKALNIDEATTIPYILELLSVKDSGLNPLAMSPEARKERTIEAIRRIMLIGSEIAPLIIAVEDLHWMDRSSEEALKHLLDSVPGSRILLIFSYRPEFVYAWGGRSYHSQVNLNRLSNRESLAMAAYILGTDSIGPDLEELIVEKMEGVPFFIEEFIRSFKDLEIIQTRDHAYHLTRDAKDMTIPSTIREVIMARVDSLPDAAKSILQIGSAIEREFSYELIKAITGISEQELLSHFAVLKDSELLYERGIYPLSTYVFKHVLTREVLYDSILSGKRKRLHREIGNAIEEVCKDNLDDQYEILAGHYITGENYEKAAHYCEVATWKPFERGVVPDSITYSEKEIFCLERLPRTPGVEKRIVEARTRLGLLYTQILYYAEAKEAVDPIVELALQRDYKSSISQIYTVMGSYYDLVEEDFPKALAYLEDALKIAEDLGDILCLAMATYSIAWCLAHICEFEKSMYYFDRILGITLVMNSLWGTSRLKSLMSVYVYCVQGQVEIGYQNSSEALRIAEESGDIGTRAIAYIFQGSTCFFKGFWEESEEYLLKGIDLCERVDLFEIVHGGHFRLSMTYYEMGDFRRSQDHAEKALALYGRISCSWMNLYKIGRARAKTMNNEKDIDLNELFRCFNDSRLKTYEGTMAACIGETLLNTGDQNMDKAEDWIKRAIRINKRNGTKFDLGSSYALYAKLLRRKGNLRGAREKLNKATKIYNECGSEGWVAKANDELASTLVHR